MLEDALVTIDDAKHEALLQRAPELAIDDTAIIPLYHQVSLRGTRNGIGYVPRTDENTLAHKFQPAQEPVGLTVRRRRKRFGRQS
jgi:peptide/nickel transport system substrate-binding protein